MQLRPICTWVVKLGGAVLATPQLRAWLDVLARSSAVRLVVVPGGGALADEVRHLQQRWAFHDAVAHELAIEAMRMHARMLASPVSDLSLTSAISVAAWNAESAPAAWWLAPPTCAELIEPASWDVTADSIALWLAQRLNAAALIVVKAVVPAELTARSATDFAADGLLDQQFPHLLAAQPLPVRIVSRLDALSFAEARATAQSSGLGVACQCG